MRLKERELEKTFYYLKPIKKWFRKLFRFIFNKKFIFLGKIFFIICFFSFGILTGLILSGYFGTFDDPSQNLLDILHEMEIRNLRQLKIEIESVLHENIKIPINYLKGQFSNPKKIYINIGFKELKQIEYKRAEALEINQLLLNDSDYVPATIRYEDNEVRVKLRLKGGIDHWKGDKWSFRIKTKGDNSFLGMQTFAIHYPGARENLNELIFQRALKKEGIISIRYEFVQVYVNGENKGIFAIEEGFDKQLIEYNNRREGILVKFEDQSTKEQDIKIQEYFSSDLVRNKYQNEHNMRDWFYNNNIEPYNGARIFNDTALSNQFNQAKNLLELFKQGRLKTSEVFDIDKLSKYYAIVSVFGCRHGTYWNNERFYYNPITSLLEPIGYDGNCGDSWSEFTSKEYALSCLNNENSCEEFPEWFDLIMRDEVFFEKYIQKLEKFSKTSYLDDLFLELNSEIKKDTNILHKDNPLYYFREDIYYDNQKQIRMDLNPKTSINVYVKERALNKITLLIANIQSFPIQIINLNSNGFDYSLNQKNNIVQPRQEGLLNYQEFEFYGNNISLENLKVNYKIFGTENIKSQEGYPWSYIEEDFSEKDFIRQEDNLSSFELLEIKEDTKTILIKKGSWTLNKSLVIPKGFSVLVEEGTVINLINHSMILSYSDVNFKGNKEQPIQITSSDGTGQGISVLNSKKKSFLNYVTFDNLINPLKENWELTGAINFYESDIELKNVIIQEINAEDGLNIINSNFSIEDSTFESCFSDCLDVDFGKGEIINSFFLDCGNDGLDFSGSLIDLKEINVFNVGDKGVSVGEGSNVSIENLKVDGANLGVASKDLSEIIINNAEISNTNYSIAAYQKKSEYGPALINANNVEIFSSKNGYIVETGSNVRINKVIVLGERKVYEKLYGKQ